MRTLEYTDYRDLKCDMYGGNIKIEVGIKVLQDLPHILKGNFDCSFCKYLKDLKGSPRFVIGNFDCYYCENLETLEGAPRKCKKFDCSGCKNLKTLEGAPEIVEGYFHCHWCENLETVDGAPKKCKVFNCEDCSKLKNLDPLLLCDIEVVEADERLLEDYYKKKAAIKKYGFELAMKIFEVIDDLD